MTIEGPKPEVLGGEEQQVAEQPQKESFDDKVHRIVNANCIVPQDLQEDFWKYYETAREEVREQVIMNMGNAYALKLPNPEDDTLASVLRTWTREMRESRQYYPYLNLMVWQKLKPVSREEFFKAKTVDRPYLKRRKAVAHILRDCIAERYEVIQKRGLLVGKTVVKSRDSEKKPLVIQAITPECHLVFEGDGVARYPFDFEVVSS